MEDKKDFFDRHAARWDETLQYRDKADQLSEVVTWFGLAEGQSVLDVGTGTGILLPFLSDAIGLEGELIAIDFAFNMLGEAKQRFCKGDKTVVNASVEAIPFRSDRFDRVTCFSAFPHFPNKVKAVHEMVRVLKPKGRVFIAHLHSVEEIDQLHQQAGGAVCHDHLPPPERVRALMVESGLQEVSVSNQPGKFLAQGQKI